MQVMTILERKAYELIDEDKEVIKNLLQWESLQLIKMFKNEEKEQMQNR